MPKGSTYHVMGQQLIKCHNFPITPDKSFYNLWESKSKRAKATVESWKDRLSGYSGCPYRHKTSDWSGALGDWHEFQQPPGRSLEMLRYLTSRKKNSVKSQNEIAIFQAIAIRSDWAALISWVFHIKLPSNLCSATPMARCGIILTPLKIPLAQSLPNGMPDLLDWIWRPTACPCALPRVHGVYASTCTTRT